MKKLGMLAVMLGVLGSAIVGCEAKKKEAPKAPPAGETAPAGDAKPAEAK